MTNTRVVRSAAGLAFLISVLAMPMSGQMVGGLGPSVMSRGGNAPGMRGSDAADFVFYGGLTGSYDSGVYIPVINANGEADSPSYYTYGAQFGAYGAHLWHRSSIGLDYRGDVYRATRSSYLSGSDHALALEYRNRLSRRWEVLGRQVAGTTSRPFGGFAAPAFLATDYMSVPTTEIYNNRVYYTQTSGYASYRQSARTLYTMEGGLFVTRRRSSALADTNGYYANGLVQRLISRNLAVGASYNYMRFTYPGTFGQADIHGATASIERHLGRSSVFTLAGGVYRMEVLGTQVYALRPEIIAILGRPTGTRVIHRVNYFPSIQASITYRRRQVSYSAGYTRGATPGNGVYLTSQSDYASAGASYSGIRRMSMGVSAYYTRLGSVTQTTPAMKYYGTGGGFSYHIGRGFNWMMQADWRTVSAGQNIANRRGVVVTTGLTFASSPVPLSLW